MKLKLTNNLAHYGDILAIPFFILTLYYFIQISEKTYLEWIITAFLAVCLLGDILFTSIFFKLIG
jgi:hypothetical protein